SHFAPTEQRTLCAFQNPGKAVYPGGHQTAHPLFAENLRRRTKRPSCPAAWDLSESAQAQRLARFLLSGTVYAGWFPPQAMASISGHEGGNPPARQTDRADGIPDTSGYPHPAAAARTPCPNGSGGAAAERRAQSPVQDQTGK